MLPFCLPVIDLKAVTMRFTMSYLRIGGSLSLRRAFNQRTAIYFCENRNDMLMPYEYATVAD